MNSQDLQISAIVAMAQNRVIGRNNQLPWHMPADLKHFKMTTSHQAIVMGRATYESIGKPLPNRINIVMTNNKAYQAPSCHLAHDFNTAVLIAQQQNVQELFVIGGAKLFQALLPYVQKLYLTIIHHDFAGDVYFPEFRANEWQKLEYVTHLADAANPYNYSFIQLMRKV